MNRRRRAPRSAPASRNDALAFWGPDPAAGSAGGDGVESGAAGAEGAARVVETGAAAAAGGRRPVAGAALIRPTSDPGAIPRSLGDPPLPTRPGVAGAHLAAVYEEAVRAATALAAVNGLLAADPDDDVDD